MVQWIKMELNEKILGNIFVNKVLLFRSEKRTVASAVDLFLIECLSKFELISLPFLMIEHMHKIIHMKDENMGCRMVIFLAGYLVILR